MSDDQRRKVCRISFAVFAVIPTLVVGIWIAWPSRTQQWEEVATRAIGWNVSADRIVERGRHDASMLTVEISHEQLGDAARINHLQVTDSANGLTLIGDHLELNAAQIPTFLDDLVRRIFLLSSGDIPPRLTLLFHRITILNRFSSEASHSSRVGMPAQTFEDVELVLVTDDDQTKASMLLRPAGESDEERIQLEIDLFRQEQGEPIMQWTLSTGRSSFPCALARQWLPFVERLGTDARFRGQIKAAKRDQSWTAEATGHLSNVDLYQLVSVPLHHTLVGEADIELVRFRLEAGRILGAAGRIRCEEGQVSGTIVAATQKHFGWRLATAEPSYPARFGQLEIGFRTDGQWLELRGDEGSHGVIAYNARNQPWLYESEQAVVSVTALIRALVPISDTEVPLTRETAALAGLLPLPSQATSAPSDSGTSRIRLESE